MINVDVKNKDFKIEGELPILLTELEFIMADIYFTMLEKGFYNKDVNDVFDEVRKNVAEKVWKIIKLENEISDQALLKDLGGIPDFLQ